MLDNLFMLLLFMLLLFMLLLFMLLSVYLEGVGVHAQPWFFLSPQFILLQRGGPMADTHAPHSHPSGSAHESITIVFV